MPSTSAYRRLLASKLWPSVLTGSKMATDRRQTSLRHPCQRQSLRGTAKTGDNQCPLRPSSAPIAAMSGRHGCPGLWPAHGATITLTAVGGRKEASHEAHTPWQGMVGFHHHQAVSRAGEANMTARMNWTEIQEVRQRVLAAFKDLRKQNIVARANFQDCQSCAGALIGDMVESRHADGYVFWHSQAEANLQSGDGMYLYFSSAKDEDADTKKIGDMVVKALRDHEVPVIWNYNPQTAIFIGRKGDA